MWIDVEKYYKVLETLGEGGYGTVKKALRLSTGSYVAIKHMTDFSDNTYRCKQVLREV